MLHGLTFVLIWIFIIAAIFVGVANTRTPNSQREPCIFLLDSKHRPIPDFLYGNIEYVTTSRYAYCLIRIWYHDSVMAEKTPMRTSRALRCIRSWHLSAERNSWKASSPSFSNENSDRICSPIENDEKPKGTSLIMFSLLHYALPYIEGRGSSQTISLMMVLRL